MSPIDMGGFLASERRCTPSGASLMLHLVFCLDAWTSSQPLI